MYRQALDKLKRWLLEHNEDRRSTSRIPQPEVVVHYWDGSAPEGRCLRDISESGAYIYTTDRWYPGTILRIVLQGRRTAAREDGTTGPAVSACIPAQVVRHGSDGVAVEFAFRDKQEGERFRSFLAAIPVQPAAAAPPPAVPKRQGQALVEFALIVPLVFLLAVNAVNFAGMIFAWITVADAARAAVDYMVVSSSSPGAPTQATQPQITALVTSDVTSLRNRASVVVAYCTNATTGSTGCTAFSDPEAPSYTLATVDVTYTYNPYIPLFSIPALGISATLPSTTIHRKAVMRMLQ